MDTTDCKVPIITALSNTLKITAFDYSTFKFPPLAKDFASFNLFPDQDKQGRTDLPYWLSEPLAQEDYISLSLPHMFHSKVLDEMRASCMVNVGQHSPYFYLFAAQIIESM